MASVEARPSRGTPQPLPRERLASLKNRQLHGSPRSTPMPSPRPSPRPVPRPTKAKPTCGNSQCTNKDVFEDDGKIVCRSCGWLIDASEITQDLTFGEASNGAAVVQGTYVGANDESARNPMIGASKIAGGLDSRQVTEQNGKAAIKRLATKLGLNQTYVDMAVNVYKLAMGINFIQGRVTEQVAAVCLYVACRRNSDSQVMLIDFSEILSINIFKLGQVYNTLVESLGLRGVAGPNQIYDVNPENLIARFARDLDFGADEFKIANEAVQVFRRLKRDWILVGRRPAGVCAAAIILAARMNNYRRTIREVVYTAKVADITIHKRLDEFKYTEASNLTVEEFRHYGIELEKDHDPPAFYERDQRKKRRKKVHEVEDDVSMEDGTSQRAISIPASEAATSQQGSPAPSDRPSRATSERARSTMSPQARAQADREAMPPPSNNARSRGTSRASRQATPIDPTLLGGDDESNADHLTALAEAAESGSLEQRSSIAPTEGSISDDSADSLTGSKRKRVGRPKGTKNKRLPYLTDKGIASQAAMEEEIDTLVQDPENIASALQAHHETSQTTLNPNIDPSLTSPATSIEAAFDPSRYAHPITEDLGYGDLDDDPEVRDCLLTPAEITVKEAVWVQENGEYLRQQQARRIKAQLAEEAGTAPKKKTRVRHRQRMGAGDWCNEDGSKPSTPAEATANMLKKRGYSSKINYANIDWLYDTPSARSRSRSGRSGSKEGEEEGVDGERESGDRSRSRSVRSQSVRSARSSAPRTSRTLVGARGDKIAMGIGEEQLPTPMATEEKGKGKVGAEKEKPIEIEDDGTESSDDPDDYIQPGEDPEGDEEREGEQYDEEYGFDNEEGYDGDGY